MRRIDIIFAVAFFIIGAGMAWYIANNEANKKLAEQQIEVLKLELLDINSKHDNILDADSIQSAIEKKLLSKNDSIANEISKELRLIKNEYRYILKKQDENIKARLDSIAHNIPVLPDF